MNGVLTTPRPRCRLLISVGRHRAFIRALMRDLDVRHTAYVGLSEHGNGPAVVGKPFCGPAWHTRASDTSLPPALLGRIIETALSVRDHEKLADEFGPAAATSELDVVVVIDTAASRTARLYRGFLDRIRPMAVLRDTPGLRIQVLMPSAIDSDLSEDVAQILSAWAREPDGFIGHTFTFRTSNLSRTFLAPRPLAVVAARGISHLLGTASDDPCRVMLHVSPHSSTPAERSWALGYARVHCDGAMVLDELERRYRSFLRSRWQRPRDALDVESEADRVVRDLLDECGDEEVPAHSLARWSIDHILETAPGRNAVSLKACLEAIVEWVAARSAAVGAEQRIPPRVPPAPRDPRGRFKKLLNSLTRGRLFRWQPLVPPKAPIPTADRLRRRIPALDEPLMRLQIEVGRLLAGLERPPGERTAALDLPRTWTDPFLGTMHTQILSELRTVREELAGEFLTDGGGFSFLRRFLDLFRARTGISEETTGPDAVTPIGRALGDAPEQWLGRVLAGLYEHAAPWWDEPGQVVERVIIYSPDEISARGLPAGTEMVTRPGGLAVLRMVRPCVPGSDTETAPVQPPPSRQWLDACEVGPWVQP